MKRISLWIVILLILLPLLMTGLQALATRVINQDAVKKRIETTISQEFGGTLRYEKVRVAILPRPRIVIERPVVSIPGSLSGTSASLDVNFDLLPLFLGHARIGHVRLDQPDLTLVLSAIAAQESPPDGSVRRSLAAVLGWLAAKMPNLAIRIDQGRVVAIREQEEVFTLKDVAIRLSFGPPDAETPDSGKAREAEPFLITGRVQGVLTRNTAFAGPVRVRIGAFEARPHTLSFSDAEIRILDAEGTLSGTFEDYLTPQPKADFTATGSAGTQAIQWVRTAASLAPELTPRAPLAISKIHLAWTRGGTARIQGSALVRRTTSLSFEVQLSPNRLTIQDLRIQDADSKAAMAMDWQPNLLDVSFRGNLTQSSLQRLFEQGRFKFGWLRGDIHTRIVLDRPRESTTQGRLEGERLVLPVQTTVPVVIERLVLRAADRTITVDPLVLALGATNHTVTGDITGSSDEWLIDLATDGLKWETLSEMFVLAASDCCHGLARVGRSPVSWNAISVRFPLSK